MPKRRQPKQNQPTLFEQLADATQARGFRTQDERTFDREQERKAKRKHVPLRPAPRTGPACLRCAHWVPPYEGDEFGTCMLLVITQQDVLWAGIKRGTTTDRETARKDWRVPYEQVRTGEGFQCSSYDRAEEVAA